MLKQVDKRDIVHPLPGDVARNDRTTHAQGLRTDRFSVLSELDPVPVEEMKQLSTTL